MKDSEDTMMIVWNLTQKRGLLMQKIVNIMEKLTRLKN